MLPDDSTQSSWIRDHVGRLDTTASASAPRPPSKWPGWLAPLGPILIALSKGTALLNAKFLLSFGVFLGVYWSQFGFAFALGFAIQILIHEMGHYIDIKRRGLPADLPMFLPGFGAYVRWSGLGVSLKTRAAVSLAGPFAGCLAAAFCAWMWWTTGNGIWAAWARAGAWLNLLNLIPIFGTDGDHAFLALTRKERVFLLASSLALLFVVVDMVLFGIALCAAFRLSTKDIPQQPGFATTAYFVAVMSALSALLWFLPGHGFGT